MQFDKYQLQAVDNLKSGSILVGGVGSGKSRTSLYYYFVKECGGSANIPGYSEYHPMIKPKDLYIITTAAKRDKREWDQELVEFLLDTDQTYSINHVKVVIDSWNNIAKYVDVKDSFFIFDEQRVVGSGTWAKSFIKISKNNRWILLTATPGDTWSDYIPVFIANGFYKNRTEFVKRHVVFDRFAKYPKISRYLDTDRLEKIRFLITVDMTDKRTIKKHSIIIPVDYDKDNYKIITKDRWNFYEDKPIKNASEYTGLLRKVVNSDQDRIKKVKDLLKTNPKAIIFYNFDYELEMLRKMGEELKVKTSEWNGHKHMPVPTEDNWIYLVQYNAGAEGWNCTTTNCVIFYSLSYSYRMTHQAAGRIDRRNSPFFDLYYYYLKSPSSIDVAISKCLSQKKDFNEKDFYEKTTSHKKQTLL